MRIQKSSVLKPTNKTISMVNNCLFAAEGPNCAGKLDLGSLNMHYDSFFSSKMTLQPKDKYMPIMYGFLGTEVTFLTIVPDYNINPQVCPPDAYIEFYYEDQPLITRTFTDILMLSGNDLHRIPQIYVYNPTDAVVELNIMVANLDINEISSLLNPIYNEINGLSFNSIISDQIYGNCGSGGTACTGATQFEILDPLSISGDTGNIQMIIGLETIDMMEINGTTITIITNVDDPIKLNFLSEFNALQAFSRMEWVYELQEFRHLDMVNPGLDITPPTVSGITTAQDINIYQDCNTNPISKDDLIFRCISKVVDYDNAGEIRDGEINIYSCDVIITDALSGELLEEIVKDGKYNVTFIYQDLAGNKTNYGKTIIVDSTGPEIIFTNNVDTQTKIINDMSIIGSTQTPETICYNDMLRHTIDSVWDSVDGEIDKLDRNKFEIIVESGGTPINFSGDTFINCSGLTLIGDYDVTFRAIDTGYNITNLSGYTLKVIDERPIVNFNDIFTGNSFMMESGDTANITIGYTYTDIRNFAISSATSSYLSPISYNNIELYIPNSICGIDGICSGGTCSGGTNDTLPCSLLGVSGITGNIVSNIMSSAGFITRYHVSGTTIDTDIETFTTDETIIKSTGIYEVIFIVVDVDGNERTFTKNLIIV